MAFIKKGTVSSIVVVSSSVYVCNECDHTEVVKDGEYDDSGKKCPQCEAEMKLVSTSAEEDESDLLSSSEEEDVIEKE